MRVAIFTETYYPFISGVVTHIQTLKEGLEARGHQVMIVTMSPTVRYHYVKDDVLYCPAIQLKKIYGYGVANPVNLQRLYILQQFKPDLLHIHTEFTMGIFGLFTARQLKIPLVYTLHTMYDDYVFYLFPERMDNVAKPAAHAYIRKVASKATEIIGPSVKVVNYMRRCGVKRHINIVPNTVDLTEFLYTDEYEEEVGQTREKLGLREGDVALIFVGRLGKEKSLDTLIQYFGSCFKGEDKYKLFIVGDGPEREALQALVHSEQLEGQVRLLGKIDHNRLRAYYWACDLFATASLSEMNSISLLEATASGLYAVQRLDIYNRDQISSGQNGEVFTDTKGFEKIVREYAELADDEKTAKRKAVSDYATRYGVNEFMDAILNVYDRAIDEF